MGKKDWNALQKIHVMQSFVRAFIDLIDARDDDKCKFDSTKGVRICNASNYNQNGVQWAEVTGKHKIKINQDFECSVRTNQIRFDQL